MKHVLKNGGSYLGPENFPLLLLQAAISKVSGQIIIFHQPGFP